MATLTYAQRLAALAAQTGDPKIQKLADAAAAAAGFTASNYTSEGLAAQQAALNASAAEESARATAAFNAEQAAKLAAAPKEGEIGYVRPSDGAVWTDMGNGVKSFVSADGTQALDMSGRWVPITDATVQAQNAEGSINSIGSTIGDALDDQLSSTFGVVADAARANTISDETAAYLTSIAAPPEGTGDESLWDKITGGLESAYDHTLGAVFGAINDSVVEPVGNLLGMSGTGADSDIVSYTMNGSVVPVEPQDGTGTGGDSTSDGTANPSTTTTTTAGSPTTTPAGERVLTAEEELMRDRRLGGANTMQAMLTGRDYANSQRQIMRSQGRAGTFLTGPQSRNAYLGRTPIFNKLGSGSYNSLLRGW